ncbi:MAG: hypothetical protein ACRD0G_07400, partial [Acidimicrobiales bacterium]
MAVQRVATDDQGRPVVVKTARPGADADRLAHEAALLTAAQHPGVVEVAAAGPDSDGRYELVTRLAGTRTIGDVSRDVAVVAGVVAAVSATLGDLHSLGIVHGRVEATHVLLAASGRPVLCGFGGGGRVGTTPAGGN